MDEPEVKCLGVHIDSNLTFQGQVKHILQKVDQEKNQFTLLEILSHKYF